MAKVSLRIYNREIESLIDQGQTDEAVAHCHHILKTFPKHLETYRLLGKAHLEAKRYTDAVDILGRVLMAVPEDFVAHVGMSIISDEQNKLDDAIWHMERAFETQPSNAAIQGELQRLYGRRDGVEPPKIRMTRGALAFMYMQGELYPQAIAEIRNVLASDPNRTDMQVLLARAYFRSGQKADTSDMCAQLLKQYPFCFEANRIMVELLPATTGTAENTQAYRTRVYEMDPYASFAKGSIFLSNEVADAAVNLERLEYTGREVPMGPDWSSTLGIGSGAVSNETGYADQPDWLRSSAASSFTPQSSPAPVSAAEEEDEIPDFLRAAGWGESNTPERPTSIFDEEPAVADAIVPADLPDWLKGQAPITEPAASAQSVDTPDWLNELSDKQPAASQSQDITDWLSGLDDQEVKTVSSKPAEDIPDWLGGLGAAATASTVAADAAPDTFNAQPADDIPDWLSGLGGQPEQETPAPAAAGLQPETGLDDFQAFTPITEKDEDIPDWLRGMETPPQSGAVVEPPPIPAAAQDDSMAWLESLAARQDVTAQEPATDQTAVPDWLGQAQDIPGQPSIESLGATSKEQDDAVAWLESLAAKHGANPDEFVTDPNLRSETPPEWVQQAQAAGQAESILNAQKEEPAQPASAQNAQDIGEKFFAEFENQSTGMVESDETGMWLRSLDQKEKQDKFITPPEAEAQEQDVPAWLKGSQSEPESAAEQDLHRPEIPEWIKSGQPLDSDDQIKFAPETPSESDLPSWLTGSGEESAVGAAVTAQASDQDLTNWLSGLDEEPGLPFEKMPTPNSILADSMPRAKTEQPASLEPAAAKSELPDWLDGVDSKPEEDLEEDLWKKSVEQELAVPASAPTSEPAPVSEAVDLPDWLQGVEEETADTKEIIIETEEDDTPPWMHREKFEAEEISKPQPTASSDWRPVETKEPVAAALAQPVKKKPALARQPQADAQSTTDVLMQAKGELDRGDIPTALAHYGKLIKKGKHLEEAIRDLNESLYRYPVEVGIWQTLGDAYMRSNRLKEALEAYNKAEELIR